jgi:hypothetical protein
MKSTAAPPSCAPPASRPGRGYVLAVPSNFIVRLPSGRKAAAAALARLIPAGCWETRSCGRGCKGHRDYRWAWAATAPAADAILPNAAAQPRDWADTGALPVSPDHKPPAEIGMVKISVPDAHRLLRLATTPMPAAARAFGHAWSI